MDLAFQNVIFCLFFLSNLEKNEIETLLYISGAIKNRYLTMTVRPTTLIYYVHQFLLTTQVENNLQRQSKIDSNFY